MVAGTRVSIWANHVSAKEYDAGGIVCKMRRRPAVVFPLVIHAETGRVAVPALSPVATVCGLLAAKPDLEARGGWAVGVTHRRRAG